MKRTKSFLITASFAFLLAGCQLSNPSPQIAVKPNIDIPPPDDVLETPPEIVKKNDWNTILSPFVKRVLDASSYSGGNHALFISDIQNRSNEYIANSQVNDALHQLVNQQNTFAVVDRETVDNAKQALGIAFDDKLVSRSKMIALAKSINVDYVLFTTIYKIPNESGESTISMELLSAQTGEILKRVTSAEIQSLQNQSTNSQREIE